MKDNISPEEKLLKLIRGPKKKPDTDKKLSIAGASDASDLISPSNSSPHLSLQKYLSFLNISKISTIIFLVFSIYLIISFLYPLVGFKKIELPQVTQEKIRDFKAEARPEIKPYEFYLKGLNNRKIFGSISLPEIQTQTTPLSSANADLIKDINLIGIISGENPQAVIEDKKAQKTYYVTKGQFVGELQVEDIREGKIIFNYKGQKYELYL